MELDGNGRRGVFLSASTVGLVVQPTWQQAGSRREGQDGPAVWQAGMAGKQVCMHRGRRGCTTGIMAVVCVVHRDDGRRSRWRRATLLEEES